MEQSNRKGDPGPGRFALRGLLSGYALYMGYTFLREYFQGTATVKPVLSWLFGAGFLLFGLLYGLFTWSAWRRVRNAASLPPASEEEERTREETETGSKPEETGDEAG